MAQPHSLIPFHVRKKVEEKLKQLENDDIIELVEGPTPWVSSIVAVTKPKKPNEIRICVDIRSLNKAIMRERYIIPTINDVVSDLNSCKVFSKNELNQGYHLILLHPNSRPLSTLSTHVGLFQYKRFNFGLSCAAESGWCNPWYTLCQEHLLRQLRWGQRQRHSWWTSEANVPSTPWGWLSITYLRVSF